MVTILILYSISDYIYIFLILLTDYSQSLPCTRLRVSPIFTFIYYLSIYLLSFISLLFTIGVLSSITSIVISVVATYPTEISYLQYILPQFTRLSQSVHTGCKSLCVNDRYPFGTTSSSSLKIILPNFAFIPENYDTYRRLSASRIHVINIIKRMCSNCAAFNSHWSLVITQEKKTSKYGSDMLFQMISGASKLLLKPGHSL